MRRERRILAEGETLAQLAVSSSRRALEMAGIQPHELDLVLLATSSPDDAFGSACQVCRKLKGHLPEEATLGWLWQTYGF